MKKFEKFENLEQKRENVAIKTGGIAPVLIQFLPQILKLLPKLQTSFVFQPQKPEKPQNITFSENSKFALKTLQKHNLTMSKLKTKKP